MPLKISEDVQTKIWDLSRSHTIGQIANKFLISRPTAKKYMNPAYI